MSETGKIYLAYRVGNPPGGGPAYQYGADGPKASYTISSEGEIQCIPEMAYVVQLAVPNDAVEYGIILVPDSGQPHAVTPKCLLSVRVGQETNKYDVPMTWYPASSPYPAGYRNGLVRPITFSSPINTTMYLRVNVAPTATQYCSEVQPDCGPYKVRLLLDIPVVDSDDPEAGEKQYLLSHNCLQGEKNLVKFEVQALEAAWKYKIRRIDLVLADGPFWGDVSWEAVDKNGNEAGQGSSIPNIGGGREITIQTPYASGIPLYNGGDNPASMVLDVFNNKHWLCLNVTLTCGDPGEIGGTQPVPPEPPEEPDPPEEEEWPHGYGPGDDILIIVEPPGQVTPPTIVTVPTTGTGPEGCECFEYLAGEIAIQAGYLGEILESVRQEVFISRRENNELLLRIETAILQEAAKNRNNLILRGLELLERLLGMNVDLGPLIAELSDGRSQSATNADTMNQAIEGLATAIQEASCCEPVCERLDKIAEGVYHEEATGEKKPLAQTIALLLAGLNVWK